MFRVGARRAEFRTSCGQVVIYFFFFVGFFFLFFWWFTHLKHVFLRTKVKSSLTLIHPGVSLLSCEPGLGLGEPTTYQVKVANYVTYSKFLAVFGMFRTMISYFAVFGSFLWHLLHFLNLYLKKVRIYQLFSCKPKI